jgi:TolA-binding protein
MQRVPTLLGLVVVCLAFLVGAGASQDAKKDKDEPKKIKGQLPAGFKDLGLSKTQISSIYTIQSDYKMKIAELDKKIKELKAKESQDVFKVLTDDQRDKYLKSKGIDTKEKAADKKDGDKK